MNNRILNFIPAQFYETKASSYVGYYILNPTTNKMVRKRIKVNRLKTRSARRLFARQLIIEINQKLVKGWNPLLEQEAPKSFTFLQEAIRLFIISKSRELRKNSMRSYNSDTDIFLKWFNKNYSEDFYIINVTNLMILDFLNYMYFERKVSEVRHNRMLMFLHSLFEWFVDNGFLKRNIVKGIKKKKEKPKTRQFIPPDVIEKIRTYIKENNKDFYRVMLLTYHGLLRPNEIVQLYISNIDLKRKIIIVPADISKNGKKRIVTLSEELFLLLKEIVLKHQSTDFICSKTFVPGKTEISPKDISKYWFKMRVILDIPVIYQFYSLKDTGIINMVRANISPEAVRDQAGHSSLEMTNKYIQIAREGADEQIINKINF